MLGFYPLIFVCIYFISHCLSYFNIQDLFCQFSVYCLSFCNQNLTNDERHVVSGEAGNTLIIDKIQREEDKLTYTCVAEESGSMLNRSRDITLGVMCRYNTSLLIIYNFTNSPGTAQAESVKIGQYI